MMTKHLYSTFSTDDEMYLQYGGKREIKAAICRTIATTAIITDCTKQMEVLIVTTTTKVFCIYQK